MCLHFLLTLFSQHHGTCSLQQANPPRWAEALGNAVLLHPVESVAESELAAVPCNAAAAVAVAVQASCGLVGFGCTC